MSASSLIISKLMKERLEAMGWSEGELGRRAGVPQPTVHRILSGASSSPKLENLQKLAKALRVDISSLLAGNRPSNEIGVSCDLAPGPTLSKPVPLISWVQAGNLGESINFCEDSDSAETWIECPFPHSESAYCLEIRGSSMHPDYRPSEVILVEPGIVPTHGDDVVVRTPPPECMTTFKRLHDTEDGRYLFALNPDFPDRILHIPEGTVFCGVVVASWIKRRRK